MVSIPGDQIKAGLEGFFRGVLLGSVESCADIVDRLLERGVDRGVILELVVTPALRQVGELWQDGEIGVGQEHLATGIAERIVAYLYPPVLSASEPSRRVLVLSVPGNLHCLGPRMVAYFLESCRFSVDFLGGDTPEPEVLAFAALTRPRAVGISLSLPSHAGAAKVLTRKLRLLLPGVRIMAGGAAVSSLDLVNSAGVDACPPSLEVAASILGTWLSCKALSPQAAPESAQG